MDFSISTNAVPLCVAIETVSVIGVTFTVPLIISESDVAVVEILFLPNDTNKDVSPIAVCVVVDAMLVSESNTTLVSPDIASGSETVTPIFGRVDACASFEIAVISVVATVTSVSVMVVTDPDVDVDESVVVVVDIPTVVSVVIQLFGTTDAVFETDVFVIVADTTLVDPIVDALAVDTVLVVVAVTDPSVGVHLNDPHDDESQSIYVI